MPVHLCSDVIANPELTLRILRLNQHLVTCPATVLELYLDRHFDDVLEITRPQIRQLVEKRARVAEYMDGLGLAYLPGTATFYHFVSIAGSALGSEAFCGRLLEERKVSVVPGRGYGESCDAFVRVSVGTETLERTRHGLRMLKETISATAPGTVTGAFRLPERGAAAPEGSGTAAVA